MHQEKIHPSEADLYNSATEALKWKEALGLTTKVPKGWKTREDVQELLNLQKSQTSNILKQGVASGKIEVKDFVVFENNKKLIKPHYFIK